MLACIKDLEGKWRLTESQGFEEYIKELGVGLALRKMGAMAKPDCIITCDSNNIVTINISAKCCLSPTATCELYASCLPELGPNEYTERLVLVTKLLGQ